MDIAHRVAQRFLAANVHMIDRNQAIRAQDKLGTRIGAKPWLRGIAVLADGSGSHYLRVNVQAMTEDVKTAVPKNVEGVPIIVQPVGKLRPL
jgi:hypothetical protein